MTNVFARLVLKNPVGVALEAVLFALVVAGVLVMLVGSIISVFVSSEAWLSVVGILQGVLTPGAQAMVEQAAGGLRFFYTLLGGFALVLSSMLLSLLYSTLVAPFLRRANVRRLERQGFTASQILQGKKEWAVLDAEQRYIFFLTAARALQVHGTEIQRIHRSSIPMGRLHRARIDLTDPDTPYHEMFFYSKDDVDQLRAAVAEL